MYLAYLLVRSPKKSLKPRTVYVGILKYIPTLEFHFNLLSSVSAYEVDILGEILSRIFDPSLKLSSSALIPSDMSNFESMKLFEIFPKKPYL